MRGWEVIGGKDFRWFREERRLGRDFFFVNNCMSEFLCLFYGFVVFENFICIF